MYALPRAASWFAHPEPNVNLNLNLPCAASVRALCMRGLTQAAHCTAQICRTKKTCTWDYLGMQSKPMLSWLRAGMVQHAP